MDRDRQHYRTRSQMAKARYFIYRVNIHRNTVISIANMEIEKEELRVRLARARTLRSLRTYQIHLRIHSVCRLIFNLQKHKRSIAAWLINELLVADYYLPPCVYNYMREAGLEI